MNSNEENDIGILKFIPEMIFGNTKNILTEEENINLQNKIIKQGRLILSEYPLGTKPDKYTFPARNRIISGLSDGVLVIEAKEKSGTLITVDFALEQGKNVFSIPGNITSKNTVGTNRLIKEGAKCVIGVEDILEEYKNIKFLWKYFNFSRIYNIIGA